MESMYCMASSFTGMVMLPPLIPRVRMLSKTWRIFPWSQTKDKKTELIPGFMECEIVYNGRITVTNWVAQNAV